MGEGGKVQSEMLGVSNTVAIQEGGVSSGQMICEG